MKRILVIVTTSLLILVMSVPSALAEKCMQPQRYYFNEAHYHQHSHHEMNNFLETISGEIMDSYEATSRQKYRYGLHLLVKTQQDTLDVHLGPIWYLEQENFSFEPGDAIVIRGSVSRESLRDRFLDSHMLTMTAIEVIKDNKILTLREEDGFPMWRANL